MYDEVKKHGEAVEHQNLCCKDLTTSAETDQLPVTEEMDSIISRYEKLRTAIRNSMEKDTIHQKKVEKYVELSANFDSWLENVEKDVAEFEPIILDENFLEQNVKQAKVR